MSCSYTQDNKGGIGISYPTHKKKPYAPLFYKFAKFICVILLVKFA